VGEVSADGTSHWIEADREAGASYVMEVEWG
jgi:hypothetical protein